MARARLDEALLRVALLPRRGRSTGPHPLAAPALGLLNALSLVRRPRARLTRVVVTDRRELQSAGGQLSRAADIALQPLRPWQDLHGTTDDTTDGTTDDTTDDDRTHEPERTTVPGVGWATLSDVRMNSTSLVLSGERLVAAPGIEQHIAAGLRLKGPSIVGHHDRTAIVDDTAPSARVDRGIRLAGFGSGNWYHWLVEILPSAALVDRLPPGIRELPVIVPEAAVQRPAWRASLDAVLPGHPTIVAPRAGYLAVDELHWLDSAVHGIRTFRDGVVPDLRLVTPDLAVLQAFRTTVLDNLGITAKADGRRVILIRPDGAKRSTNQQDLLTVARSHDLEPVDPGTLTFREQVRLFARSEVIVGGWGAAWSSMLFAAPDARGLMWVPAYFREWPLYSNLAPVSGMTLHHLFIDTESPTFYAANNAPQSVPLDEFDAALSALG